MSQLSHFDASGAARMVNVGGKEVTQRFARARAVVVMDRATQQRIRDGQVAKGDVLQVARLAGIMAAKRTGELIPLCHPLPLDAVEIDFQFPDDQQVAIEARVWVTARTGVEMESLLAAATAALTIYDMCKSVDRQMSIQYVQLQEKSGGRSGQFRRQTSAEGQP
jgi:cyclic pyranopterin monophosphate synthase